MKGESKLEEPELKEAENPPPRGSYHRAKRTKFEGKKELFNANSMHGPEPHEKYRTMERVAIEEPKQAKAYGEERNPTTEILVRPTTHV
jgi:hypothetical protein